MSAISRSMKGLAKELGVPRDRALAALARPGGAHRPAPAALGPARVRRGRHARRARRRSTRADPRPRRHGTGSARRCRQPPDRRRPERQGVEGRHAAGLRRTARERSVDPERPAAIACSVRAAGCGSSSSRSETGSLWQRYPHSPPWGRRRQRARTRAEATRHRTPRRRRGRRCASYATLLEDEKLKALAESDLFWDRVVAVEPAGEEEVYDLTVPGPRRGSPTGSSATTREPSSRMPTS